MVIKSDSLQKTYIYFRFLFRTQMSDFHKKPPIPPKQARKCLENILYEISEKTLYNIAAILAQERSVKVESFANSKGNWSWPVVERFLHERGYKCTQASNGTSWLLDSPTFLIKPGSGFVGFIDTTTLESFAYRHDNWTTGSTTISKENINGFLQKGQTYAVHKMWAPLEPFYVQNKAFHITTDDSKWIRYECTPESCWRPAPVSYAKRETAVKKYMRAHKKTPILMSNDKEMVICTPQKNGFKSVPVLNYDFLSLSETTQRVAETLIAKVYDQIEIKKGGWNHLAHALFSTLYHLGGKVKTQDFSQFTDEELHILEQYENGMYKKDNK